MEQRRYSVLKAGKMENCKDFSEFNKRPNWRRLGQSIPWTAAFVGCSCGALVSIYQNWFKEAAVVNQQQADGRSRLSDAQTSYCSSIVAQIWLWWQVSEYTVHTGLNWWLRRLGWTAFWDLRSTFPQLSGNCLNSYQWDHKILLIDTMPGGKYIGALPRQLDRAKQQFWTFCGFMCRSDFCCRKSWKFI